MFAVGFGPLNPVFSAVGYDRIPVRLRGRVFGVLAGTSYAVMPLGPLLAGMALDGIGLRPTMVILGTITLVLTLCPLIFPIWREMDAASRQGSGCEEVHSVGTGTTA